MSTPATMYQVDSCLIRLVRLVLPLLICGLVALALIATSTGLSQRAAADAHEAGAATGSSEQPVLPPPSPVRVLAIGDDARQETALTVLLLLAAANARARRVSEARLPDRFGSRHTVDAGRVQ